MIAIVGLGVIGGSYAMALRRAGYDQVCAIDQDEQTLEKALAMNLICAGSTHGKQLRVRDIIEMNRPGLYQQLSRGDKCRVGRAVSKLYNQGMLPHLTRGKKKGSTNTYFC